ncbi:MAG: hypothetical protein CMO01_18580 [Thalassobius sp.]|nr:hypothetical protein [Thalassovita sp.]
MKKNKKESVLDFLKNTVDYTDDTAIKENIIIHPDLEPFIFPLTQEEFSQLETNILEEGCRDPLVVWNSPDNQKILVDGHNRIRICRKHGLDFKISNKHFNDMQAVENWMINNQLGRRNLNTEQIAILRGRQYNQLKKGHGGQEFFNTDPSGQSDHSDAKTSEKLAKVHKVSEKTIRRDGNFSAGMDKIRAQNEQLYSDIISKKVKVKRDDIEKLAKVNDGQIASDIEALINSSSTKSAPVKTVANTTQTVKLESEKKKFVTQAEKLKKLGLSKKELRSLLDQLF